MKKLKHLEPLAAVQTWLDGGFGMDEESSLCEAIRKDVRITLSDEEIEDAIFEAMEEEDCDAATLLERLATPR